MHPQAKATARSFSWEIEQVEVVRRLEWMMSTNQPSRKIYTEASALAPISKLAIQYVEYSTVAAKDTHTK